MTTDCSAQQLEFQGVNRRTLVATFDGGTLTSDAGVLLLAEVERKRGIVRQFAACFQDRRHPTFVEHRLEELVSQRVLGLALAYEDLNDHDELRTDPLLATVMGKADPTGNDRRQKRDRGKPLAGKSTLNRLEWGAVKQDRYRKIGVDSEAVDRFFVEVFLSAYESAPTQIILDLDATDDPLHGEQEGRFFHGYYGEYCYLPLYIFCGPHLLCARLRNSDRDASAGAVTEVERIVAQIRSLWPKVQIILRADSGFAREELMAWCEQHEVKFVFGLARNARLQRALGGELAQARDQFEQSSQATRIFRDFTYRTRKSWSCERRVIGKAEHLAKGANPRFIVTSLTAESWPAAALYEQLYCARGEMENRIKEQQLCLFADRTSSHALASNQLRLWFSSVAYILLNELRRLGLQGTELARARCDTIRTKLLKIGAQVRVTVRRVWVQLASSYPYATLFTHIVGQLRAGPTPIG
ncbi:MAG TPA: IS1380 family transposase, partial [Thermoanaerobaculia bacterium]|nr:IS1380 family transposase [Thermoanaerobaculia bacterium]